MTQTKNIQAGERTQSLFRKGELLSFLVPSFGEGLLTGVQHIAYKGDRYRVTYTDGMVEEARCPKLKMPESIVHIVSAVQAQRQSHTV